MPQAGDPPIVVWAKQGTALVIAVSVMGGAAMWVGGKLLRWTVVPIVEERLKAGEVRDSLIVSQLVQLSEQNRTIATALMFPDGSDRRDDLLRGVRRIAPRPVVLPDDAKNVDQEKDKELQ